MNPSFPATAVIAEIHGEWAHCHIKPYSTAHYLVPMEWFESPDIGSELAVLISANPFSANINIEPA